MKKHDFTFCYIGKCYGCDKPKAVRYGDWMCRECATKKISKENLAGEKNESP